MDNLAIEKAMTMDTLRPGDIFSFHDGFVDSKAEFVDSKRVNLLAKMNGVIYKIRKDSFIEIITRAKPKEKAKMNMKIGELFYIKQGTRALLFEFVSMNGQKIIGKDVLTGGKVTMPQSMLVGTVKQYQERQALTKAE